MLKEISESISGLLTALGSNRGWKIVSILFVLALVSWLVEAQFDLVLFWNLERKVSLLKELNSLAQNGVTKSSDLNPIYQNLAKELARIGAPPILTSSFSIGFFKFVSGAFFWFAFLALALFVGAKPDDKAITLDDSMTGLVMLGLFFGVVGVILPFVSPSINYLGFPLAQVLLFFIIFWWWKRARRRVA